MLTYVYQCYRCEHKFEERQRITDQPLEKCPKCEGRVRRLMSGGSAINISGNSNDGCEMQGASCGEHSCCPGCEHSY